MASQVGRQRDNTWCEAAGVDLATLDATIEDGADQAVIRYLPSAMTLAKQTVLGAARLASESDEPPTTLREQVTSPNGTTAAALSILMDLEDGLTSLVTKAVAAAKARSIELGR